MDVEHTDDDLEELERDPDKKTSFAKNIVRAFRKVMNIIRKADDLRDIRHMRSLNFEKLKGKRKHQHSLRLNEQWRLIVELDDDKGVMKIIEIDDYH